MQWTNKNNAARWTSETSCFPVVFQLLFSGLERSACLFDEVMQWTRELFAIVYSHANNNQCLTNGKNNAFTTGLKQASGIGSSVDNACGQFKSNLKLTFFSLKYNYSHVHFPSRQNLFISCALQVLPYWHYKYWHCYNPFISFHIFSNLTTVKLPLFTGK